MPFFLEGPHVAPVLHSGFRLGIFIPGMEKT